MTLYEQKPSKIEEQALTVYHFWICRDLNPEHEETFERHLLGLFEELKECLPSATEEALEDAMNRRSRFEEKKS